MRKNRIPKPVTILVLTLLTAILWIGLNIYRAFTVKPTMPVPENVSKSLNPVLDTDTIQQIESAIYLRGSEIPQIDANVQTSTTPTPLPVGENEENYEANLEETQATESGSNLE